MEITGKLIQTLSIQSGVSAKGEWKKQDFVIETAEQYPKKVCVSAWGDMVGYLNNIEIGSHITCSINIESREYNGRWYTEVRAWRVEGKRVETATQTDSERHEPEGYDDLPF